VLLYGSAALARADGRAAGRASGASRRGIAQPGTDQLFLEADAAGTLTALLAPGDWLVIGWFTEDSTYRPLAEAFAANLSQHRAPFHLFAKPSLGAWNTRRKPADSLAHTDRRLGLLVETCPCRRDAGVQRMDAGEGLAGRSPHPPAHRTGPLASLSRRGVVGRRAVDQPLHEHGSGFLSRLP